MDIPFRIQIAPISHPVYVSLSKNLSLIVSRGKAVEEDERANFIKLLKDGGFRNFIDVGANIGIYGFIFRSVVKSSAVTLVEADANNVKLIRKTVARSGMAGMTIVEAAASDMEGIATFYEDDLSGSTGSLRGGNDRAFISVHHHRKPQEITVRCVMLDSLFRDGDAPDFIKIDVEGAELQVLRGAERLIAQSRPALFFECDADQASVHAFLAKHGYVFFDLSSMNPVVEIPHNCLALHTDKHSRIIESIAIPARA